MMFLNDNQIKTLQRIANDKASCDAKRLYHSVCSMLQRDIVVNGSIYTSNYGITITAYGQTQKVNLKTGT